MKRASLFSSLRVLDEGAAAEELRVLAAGAAADELVAAGAGVAILLTGLAGVLPRSRSVFSRMRLAKSSVGASVVVFSTGGGTKIETRSVVAHIVRKVIMLVVRNFPLVETTHRVHIRRRHGRRRLDEDYVPALAHIPLLWIEDAKRRAIQAVPNGASSPSARVQFPDVSFDVHKRSSADGPQMSKGRILAVESLVRRRVTQQGGVRNRVPQKSDSLYEFPSKKVRQTGVHQQAPNNA